MAFKHKFTYEEKVKIVSEYIDGTYGFREICKRYDINQGSLKDWKQLYETFGWSGLKTGSKTTRYSKETKEAAVRDYLSHEFTFPEILKKYQIRSGTQLKKWIKKYNGSVKAAEQRITQINNELNTQKVIQKHCDSYRLCRKVIEDCKSAKNPKAYRTKHQAEYQLHDSLKKELQDLGVTKIPSSNKIQKRIENLESEQTATVREKQELQKKLKTLEIIQQNFTALLDAPKIRLTSSKAGICFCLKR